MSILGVINGISQAFANMHDGALDEDGELIEIGLSREEGHPIYDSRDNDRFSAKILPGGELCIYYHVDGLKLSEAHGKNFESDVNDRIENVKAFIQKEYKRLTGKTLGLKQVKDTDCCIHLEYISRVRTLVSAHKQYNIAGYDVEDSTSSPNYADESDSQGKFKKFLEQGGWGDSTGKKHVSKKKDSHKHFDPYSL